jgi:Cu(I)/Ag(I) efflux system periplasmic protein CusF
MGEIKNLDMPPMTMVLVVAKPELLDQVKAGDKVRFRAANQGGSFVVELQAVQ